MSLCAPHALSTVRASVSTECVAQVLENVGMEVDIAELEDVEVDESLAVPLKRMPHNSAGAVFVVLAREEGSLSRGTVPTTMKFLVKEVDVASGDVEEDGYDDEYTLEDLEVLFSSAPPSLLFHASPVRASGVGSMSLLFGVGTPYMCKLAT